MGGWVCLQGGDNGPGGRAGIWLAKRQDPAQQPIRFRLSHCLHPMSEHCRRCLLSPNQFSLASTPNLPYSQLVLAKLWQLFYCIDYSKPQALLSHNLSERNFLCTVHTPNRGGEVSSLLHGSLLLSGRSFKNSWAKEVLAQMRTTANAADHSLSFIMALSLNRPSAYLCSPDGWPDPYHNIMSA